MSHFEDTMPHCSLYNRLFQIVYTRIMFEWLSKKRREQQRKEAHEKELKEVLSKKLANYKEPESEPVDHFIMLIIGGQKHRVANEQITITDISPNAVHEKTCQGVP